MSRYVSKRGEKMTRDEAIKILDTIPTIGEQVDALDMAIEALEELTSSEPIKLHVDHDLTEEEIKNLKQKIADSPIVFMPSVERKGKWVVDDEFIDCSACRKEKWSRVPYEDLVKRFRFCPNCGARMDEDDDNDDN